MAGVAGDDRSRWKADDPFRNCEGVIDGLAYCRRKAVAPTDHRDEPLRVRLRGEKP
jgi:hypothetical protein